MKNSEKSTSVFTMGASSSDDDKPRSFVTMDSSASDIITLFNASSVCPGSSIPSSSVRSFHTWATNKGSNKGISHPGSLGSAAAVAAAETASAPGAGPLPFNPSRCRSNDGDMSPLSMRTFSLPGSETLCGAPSPSAPDAQQYSGCSGTGGNNDGDDDDDDGNYVDHDVLMSALRRAGILVDEGAEAAVPLGDLEHSSPASVAAEHDNEIHGRGREGVTLSTVSLNDNDGQRGGEGDGGDEGEEEMMKWYEVLNSYSPASMGSMPQLVDHNEPRLAKERTDELVKILARGEDMLTAVLDVHRARQCDLDLSTFGANVDLQREGIIGAGYYGRVSRVKHLSSGAMMALKELTEVRKGR